MSLVSGVYSSPVKGTLPAAEVLDPYGALELPPMNEDLAKWIGAALGAGAGAYVVGQFVIGNFRSALRYPSMRNEMLVGAVVGAVVGYYVAPLLASKLGA